MRYLNLQTINALSRNDYLTTTPYPYINPTNFLTADGFENLRMNLPELSIFEMDPGYSKDKRSKNRWELNYSKRIPVPQPWLDFINELQGPNYAAFIKKMTGIDKFYLRFQWHFCANGFFILPHVDSVKKLATHIFYLNTDQDWNEDWGGQTMILDNHTYDRTETKQFSDFAKPGFSRMLNNRSLFWENIPHSWHAVSEVKCPDQALRLLFTVIVENPLPLREKISLIVKNSLTKTEVASHGMQPPIMSPEIVQQHT